MGSNGIEKDLKKLKIDEDSMVLDDKEKFEDVLKQRFFYSPSAEIYGGVAGLYDMGPIGCALENNIIETWRKHFVYEDSLLEIRASQLTPRAVLEASGHVERFSDLMVKDEVNGDCFRCDHLLKSHFEGLLKTKNLSAQLKDEYEALISKIDNLKKDQITEIIEKYNVVSPITKNKLTEPAEFNLMFSTTIGPAGNLQGFLRPETAQGIFINFKRLMNYSNKMPFGVAQVGFSFRNEISPRSGLIRLREFLMAEIEYFVSPDCKQHNKFNTVSSIKACFLSSKQQLSGQPCVVMTLKEAVDQGLVKNSVLGYYIGRIILFLEKIGIDMSRVRFRQHLPNEMAHYACDCWDCEINSYYGWVECIGCADRSCYDLLQHSEKSGNKLVVKEQLSTPLVAKTCEVVINKSTIGKLFKKESSKVIEFLENLSVEEGTIVMNSLANDGEFILKQADSTFKITKDMIQKIDITEKEVFVKEYVPHVIEPSFGIGRILYSLLSHNVRVRKSDNQKIYFKFPPLVAPVKCSIFPLSTKTEFFPLIEHFSNLLGKAGITYKVDDNGVSIGKRYARADELGIPYAITIDFDTLKSGDNYSVTLRERDSTEQIRINGNEVCSTLKSFIEDPSNWQKLVNDGSKFLGQKSIHSND